MKQVMNGFIQNYNGAAELKRLGFGLDRAEIKPIHIEVAQNKFVEDKKHKAVWNTDKDHLSAVVSPAYNIFQHQDLVDTAVETLIGLGLPVKGKLYNLGDKVFASILIDKKVQMNGEDFYFGFRLGNSFDKSTAITGQFYAMRLACQNGMLVPKTETLVLSEKHTTKKDVEQMIHQLVNNSAKVSQELNLMISEAMSEAFEGTLLTQIWENMGMNEKWQKALTEQLHADWGAKPIYTKWEIYNAITSIATHNHSLGKSTFFNMEKRAAKFLKASRPQILTPKVR